MNTLVAISSSPDFFPALEASLEDWHVAAFPDVAEASALLRTPICRAAVLHAPVATPSMLRAVRDIRAAQPAIYLMVFTDQPGSGKWQDDAFLQGADQIFSTPLRPRLLQALLDRLPVPTENKPPAPPANAASETPLRIASPADSTLELISDFLSEVRRQLGINRIALFTKGSAQGFACAASHGITPNVLPHIHLSSAHGLGAWLASTGRVASSEHHPELQALQLRHAIPVQTINGTLTAILCVDDPLAGPGLAPSQIVALFQSAEVLARDLERLHLREQAAAQSRVIAQVLERKGLGIVIIGADETLLHVSQQVAAFIAMPSKATHVQELPDPLPEIYQQTRGTRHPVERTLDHEEKSIRIESFQDASDDRIYLILEDVSWHTASEKAAVEKANEHLVQSMAEHLAHEIGNSLAPLSTHQQLLATRFDDPEFRESLSQSMAETVRRINRFSQQVIHLSRPDPGRLDAVPVDALIYEAFQEAQKNHGGATVRLALAENESQFHILANRKSMQHALTEIFLNALQSGGDHAIIDVQVGLNAASPELLDITICDNGPGFTDETAKLCRQPFYSTRNVGLGLGLTTASRVIELTGGSMEIRAGDKSHGGCLVIQCPIGFPARQLQPVTTLN